MSGNKMGIAITYLPIKTHSVRIVLFFVFVSLWILSTESIASSFPDTQYGPVIANGQCPEIPSNFPNQTLVSTYGEFVTAYRVASPGDAVVIANGNYDWTQFIPLSSEFSRGAERPLVLDNGGTSSLPIYILAESQLGVVFENSENEWVFNASNIVIAGFKMIKTGKFFVVASDVRIACTDWQDDDGTHILVENMHADRIEIDNNVFRGPANHGITLWRCNPSMVDCTQNSKNAHIHHNKFTEKPFAGVNGHEAVVLGLAFSPVPGETIYNVDGENMDAIVENNLFDGWDGENELISIKSSRNIVRNNCVVNAPHANFKMRNGNNNTLTGNWIENSGAGFEISGKGNYIAFNYYKKSNTAALRLHTGEQYLPDHPNPRFRNLYQYIDASDNNIEHNVFNGPIDMVEVRPRVNRVFLSQPINNTIRNNEIYSINFNGSNESGGYDNSDGNMPEIEFRSSNNWGDNELLYQFLPSSSCGNGSLFEGPGGSGASIAGNSALLGNPALITAPSWWSKTQSGPGSNAQLRVTDGLSVLYTFDAGSGNTIFDKSDVGDSLNLTISDPTKTSWGAGSLTILEPTLIGSVAGANKISAAVKSSNEITIEAWVAPANPGQTGPARIVSISESLTSRNMTLGQDGTSYDVRLRTTTIGNNGKPPSVTSNAGSLSVDLSHVVYTRDEDGAAILYVNNEILQSDSIDGDLSNWIDDFELLLANESTADRPWLGSFELVAVYDRALTFDEVSQNFNVGPDPLIGNNTAPIAQDDSVSTDEHTPFVGNLFGDYGNGVDSDDDLDTIFVLAVNDDSLLVGRDATTPAGGIVSVQVNGDFIYSPNGQFDFLDVGELSSDSFTYTITDGRGGIDSAVVDVTISGVAGANSAPVAQDDFLVTNKFLILSGNLFVDNGAGEDSDVDQDDISVTSVNGSPVGTTSATPLGALVLADADGSFTYAPNGMFSNLVSGDSVVDTFSYTIDDGKSATDTGTVMITVNGLDDPYTFTFLANSTANLQNPHDIKLSPDRQHLFVSDVENDRVVVLDADSLTFVTEWGNDHQDGTHDIDFDAEGRAYVADTFNDRVTVYDIDVESGLGTLLPNKELSDASLETVEGVLVHPNGRVYVSGVGSNNIVVFENGVLVDATSAVEIGGLAKPHDIEVTSTGDIWVSDSNNNRLVLFDPDTLTVKELRAGQPYNFDGVRYQDVRLDDTLIAADKLNHSFKIMSAEGALLQVLGNEGVPGIGDKLFRTPEGVEVLGDVIWLADSGNNRVVKYWMTDSAVNAPPLAQNDNSSVYFGNTVMIDVLSNDVDETVISQLPVLVSTPVYGTAVVNQSTGIFEYTANSGTDALVDTFTYTIDDSNGATSNEATIFVSVTEGPVNTPPIAIPDAFIQSKNFVLTGNVLTNNGSGADSDVDGDELSVMAVNGSTADVDTLVELASGALLTQTANGMFTYDPNGQYDDLVEGQQITDTYEYTIDDGNQGVSMALVTITITGSDDPVMSGRVVDGLLALYSFEAGSGNTVADVSGVGAPLNLTIANVETTTLWDNGTLEIIAPTSITSAGAATKINTAISASGELTIEAWIEPANTTQSGPARIVSVSADGGNRNATLGQRGSVYDIRLRTTSTGSNGTQPSLRSASNTVVAAMTHMVYTREVGGAAAIYIDGVLTESGTITGNLSDWSPVYGLILGNEQTGNRFWLGTFDLVSFYDRALSDAEVMQNFNAGPSLSNGGGNTAPQAQSDAFDTLENTELTGDVLADNGNGADSDAENDTLSVVAVNGNAGNVGTQIVLASGALLTQTGGGGFTYDPNGQFDDLASGEVLTDSYAYTIGDGNGGSDTAMVMIQVNMASGPTAVDDTVVVAARGVGRLQVLANDIGAIDSSTLTLLTQPNHGRALVNADGTITYLHNGTGTSDSITYTVDSDTGVTSNAATLSITFNQPGNRPPIAANDTASTTNSNTVIIAVLDNDTDLDGTMVPATVSIATGPANGMAVANANGTITYTHNGSTTTTDTFQYEVDDNDNATSNPGTVQIVISNPSNSPPVSISVDAARSQRISDGMEALYTFSAGSGATVFDRSGIEPAINLTVQNTNAVSWRPGSLTVVNNTSIESSNAVTRLATAISASNEISLEAWITAGDLSQTGPARIVSYSTDAYGRNFTLGQTGDRLQMRLRTTLTDANGVSRSLTSPPASLDATQIHVIYTRTVDGTARLYLNGAQVSSRQTPGDFSGWDTNNRLNLANEFVNERPWLGEFDLVAIYSRALSASEVSQNYSAGP